MNEKEELLETGSDSEAISSGDGVSSEDEASQPVESPKAREPMPAVESRFMFVHIAALRAKQLRRGALPRVPQSSDAEPDGTSSQKLERTAMVEVDGGLIVYDIPDPGL